MYADETYERKIELVKCEAPIDGTVIGVARNGGRDIHQSVV